MVELLVLFESVINSWWFLRTSIIFFLNKIDVFKTKLPKVCLHLSVPFVPSHHCLPGSAGEIFPRVLRWRWYQQGCQIYTLEIYADELCTPFNLSTVCAGPLCPSTQLMPAQISLTQATDTMNICLVFAAVKETILQNVLKNSGIL